MPQPDQTKIIKPSPDVRIKMLVSGRCEDGCDREDRPAPLDPGPPGTRGVPSASQPIAAATDLLAQPYSGNPKVLNPPLHNLDPLKADASTGLDPPGRRPHITADALSHSTDSLYQLVSSILENREGETSAMGPSLRALVSYASNLIAQFPLFDNYLGDVSPYEPLSGAPSCPFDGPVSCQNNTPVTGDSCCFVHPGGRMLLAQFWDEEIHVGGDEEDWTLRGLW